MLENLLKPKFDEKIMNPLVAKIAAVIPSPTAITLMALIFGVVAAFSLVAGQKTTALIALWLSGCLDALDGAMARYLKKSSLSGALLDIVSDRIVEIALVFGLFALSPIERAFPALLMMGAILLSVTSFLSLALFTKKNQTYSFAEGMIERFEAFLFFSAMILFPSSFYILANLFTLFVIVTTFSKLFQFILAEKN